MSRLTQATASRQMWEERWTKAGRPNSGPINRSYLRSCLREMDAVLGGIDSREADRHIGHEHRKSLSIDHDTACPVYSEGKANNKCTCHYSDARCIER